MMENGMMKRNNVFTHLRIRMPVFILVSVFLFTLANSLISFAAEKDNDTYRLDDIRVSATKTETALKDVSTNIAIITRDQIDRYEARDISDLLRQIPGFYIAPQAYGVRADVLVSSRGNEPGSRATMIMVNGIEFNNPSSYFNLYKIPINDIERIEVIKSPTSALYGNVATGGVINVITRQASEPLEVKSGIAFGSYETTRGYAVLNGSTEKWKYYVEASFSDTDGYQDNSWERYKNFYGKVDYALDKTSSLELHADYAPSQHGYPGGLTLDQFNEDNTQTIQPEGDSDNHLGVGAIVYKKAFSSSDLLAKLQYGTQFDCYFIDIGAWFETDDRIIIPEINYTIRHDLAGMSNSILMGVEYRNYEGESKQYQETNGVRGDLTQDRESQEDIWGFFIQDDLKVTDRLTVSLGARFDRYSMEMEDATDPTTNYDISDSALSPRVGATYFLSEGATLFANYSAGFKKPTTTSFTVNRNLEPEKIDSYEAGLRGQPTSWFNYNMAFFLIDTTDKVIKTQSTVPIIYENAGKTRSYGLEFSANVTLDNGLYASANCTFQKSEYLDFTLTSGESYNDKDLPRIPDYLYGIAVGYKNDLLGDISIYLNGTGPKFLDNDNLREWESYCVVNAKYSKRFTQWDPNVQFFIAGENLTDEKYVEVGWAGQNWEELYVTPGISIIGGINIFY